MTSTNARRDGAETPVEPVVFSHESTEEPTTRPAGGQQTRHIQFSAPDAAREGRRSA